MADLATEQWAQRCDFTLTPQEGWFECKFCPAVLQEGDLLAHHYEHEDADGAGSNGGDSQ